MGSIYGFFGIIVGVLFFIYWVGSLFFPKGRKLLSKIFDSTMLGDILDIDEDIQFDEEDSIWMIGLISLLAIMVIFLYILGVLVCSLLVCLLWPLIVIIFLSGFIIKRIQKKKREEKLNN